jgi:hypothetical protein
MAMKKLTPTEIKETVEKIRRKYNEYNYKYFKSNRHKRNFESRYHDALKSGVDISSFLLAEISAITEILKREEEKVMTKKIERKPDERKSIADQVVEENRKKIDKYHANEIHPDANDEVRRLLGALHALEQEYWPTLYNVLRNTMYSLNTKTMMNIETQLHALGGSGKDGIATRLERYIARLARFPRDYTMIDKEEKDYILESAFLLHELEEILASAREKYGTTLNTDEKDQLLEVHKYVNAIITDFRLKDLKRR